MTIQRKLNQVDVQCMVEYSDIERLYARRATLLADALEGRGKIVHVQVANMTDVGALRWVYPGGVMPLVVAPDTVEVVIYAMEAAASMGVPVFMLFEQPGEFEQLIGEQRPMVLTMPRKSSGTAFLPGPRPPDAGKPAGLDRWVRDKAEAFARFDLDEGDAPKPDWLVISYGLGTRAANAAVTEARKQGLGVAHLALETIYPLPERKIAALAMGKRFIVVPENNAGQLHGDIQRIVPSLPVVSVQGLERPVSSDDVLAALMKFPRCC